MNSPSFFFFALFLMTAAMTTMTTIVMINQVAYADHLPATQPRMFQEYCVNYQYVGQAPNPLNVQCEETKQACEQTYADYLAREDLQPTSECYKADVGKLATVYCINYQYVGQAPNPNNIQCEPTMEACEQRYAEYLAREDLQPTSECYKHEKQYVNFSEHPYLEPYR